MTDHQKLVLETAAKILSGILSGRMAANANFDIGSVRPMHVQGSINLAMALVEETARNVPADGPGNG